MNSVVNVRICFWTGSKFMAKVAVIGLDCFDPHLVFELWRDELPNLSKLMAEGTWGKLESTMAGLKPTDETDATVSRMRKELKRSRKNLFGDHYERISPRAGVRRYQRDLPKPTKKTFRQGHISQNVALIMRDPPSAVLDA